MMNYEMEELLPIVARLAESYTSKESTSISYEKAKQLMEAVLYCIMHCADNNQLITNEKPTATEAYRWGYERVLQKVKETQFVYNEMIFNFNAYGNENCRDTVTKAIPGFFHYYDARYAPQENIISMDYPTISPIADSSGIDAITKYVQYLSYEQRFLGALPEKYVYEVLYRFDARYRKQFYNICSIILRHILGHMMIGKSLDEVTSNKDYEVLQEIVLQHDSKWGEKTLTILLDKLIQEKYNNDSLMEDYLQGGLKDFATELYVAAQHNNIQKIVVL